MAWWNANMSLREVLSRSGIPEPNTGCILWIGSYSTDGYPKYAGKRINRWICEEIYGAVGVFQGCHRCHVPACVNPEHIYVGSALSNHLDRVARGTFVNTVRARDAFWLSKTITERRELLGPATEGAVRHWNSLSLEERSKVGQRAAYGRWSK